MIGVTRTTTTRIELEDPVQPQRALDPVRDPAAERAADRHPAEEAGQDRRDGLGRVAEDEDELARPDDLVDEAGRAGQDEDGQDEFCASGKAKRSGARRPGAGGSRARLGAPTAAVVAVSAGSAVLRRRRPRDRGRRAAGTASAKT